MTIGLASGTKCCDDRFFLVERTNGNGRLRGTSRELERQRRGQINSKQHACLRKEARH